MLTINSQKIIRGLLFSFFFFADKIWSLNLVKNLEVRCLFSRLFPILFQNFHFIHFFFVFFFLNRMISKPTLTSLLDYKTTPSKRICRETATSDLLLKETTPFSLAWDNLGWLNDNYITKIPRMPWVERTTGIGKLDNAALGTIHETYCERCYRYFIVRGRIRQVFQENGVTIKSRHPSAKIEFL